MVGCDLCGDEHIILYPILVKDNNIGFSIIEVYKHLCERCIKNIGNYGLEELNLSY